MQMKDVRPFLRFEHRRHGINSVESEKAGRPVQNVIPFVIVVSSGGTEHEAIATEWLAKKRREAIGGNYNPDWVDHFEKAFEAWKAGQELPKEGTPIATWQMIADQGVRERITSAGVTTVEELMSIPDNSPHAMMIGLDWRVWRDMARTWHDEGVSKGSHAKENADLKARLDLLEGMLSASQEKIRELEADRPKRGRPSLQAA
jgi:hypothetical protein